jgi:hypothetical protein|tara:strand:+ start:140 stop:286 length:147 start_codon:yes stop_codon:yes gene_type:complete
MNSKVLLVLAKQEVRWEAKFGRELSLEQALINQTNKLSKLQREDDSRF